jgi:hypothetical protein
LRSELWHPGEESLADAACLAVENLHMLLPCHSDLLFGASTKLVQWIVEQLKPASLAPVICDAADNG